MQSAIIQLRSAYRSLSAVEHSVAEYIFENQDKIPEMSARGIASKLGIAPSGIVRLCKRLGFSGFSEFKLNLIRSGSSDSSEELLSEKGDFTAAAVMTKILRDNTETIKATFSMTDPETIERLAKRITEANSLHFFGFGTSATVARDAAYSFRRAGKKAYAVTDNDNMETYADNLRENDIAVGISNEGKSAGIISSLNCAKKHGAYTVAFTSSPGSLITKTADETVLTYPSVVRTYDAYVTRTSQCLIFDVLMQLVYIRLRGHEDIKNYGV